MTTIWQPRCQCGNPARDGRPTCGIVICLANDAYERALAESALTRARKAAQA
jgi:hypothetical protein